MYVVKEYPKFCDFFLLNNICQRVIKKIIALIFKVSKYCVDVWKLLNIVFPPNNQFWPSLIR